MPPKGASTVAKPIRLPPLSKLRVRRPNATAEAPCVGLLSSVLSCWASSGHTSEGCIKLEQSLRACMDQPRPKNPPKNNINFHLSRLYPRIIGPHKRNK